MRFYCEDFLALRPTPKLEDYPLTAVRDCLFNIFASTLHIGGRSSTRNLRKCHAVVTGTHITQQVKECSNYLLSQRFDSTSLSYWISVIFNLHYFGFLQSLVFALLQEITETKRASRLKITQNDQNLTQRRLSLSPKHFHKILYRAILRDFFFQVISVFAEIQQIRKAFYMKTVICIYSHLRKPLHSATHTHTHTQ